MNSESKKSFVQALSLLEDQNKAIFSLMRAALEEQEIAGPTGVDYSNVLHAKEKVRLAQAIKVQGFQDNLDELTKEYNQPFVELAANFRKDVLLPLCTKYQLDYSSYYGILFRFTRGREEILVEGDSIGWGNWKKMPQDMKEELIPVFNFLITPIGNKTMSAFIEDIVL